MGAGRRARTSRVHQRLSCWPLHHGAPAQRIWGDEGSVIFDGYESTRHGRGLEVPDPAQWVFRWRCGGGLMSVVGGCMSTVTSAPIARVDYRLAHPLAAGLASQQEARAQSTGTSHRQHDPAGQARTGSHHMVASAEQRDHRSAYPRTDQHPQLDVTGSAENHSHTSCWWKHDPITGQLLATCSAVQAASIVAITRGPAPVLVPQSAEGFVWGRAGSRSAT